MRSNDRIIPIVVSILGLVILISLVLMVGGGMMGWGMMGGYSSGWGWSFWMWLPATISIIAFSILIIMGAVLLARWLSGSTSSTTQKAALDILQRRYASGEISKEQYEETRRALEE